MITITDTQAERIRKDLTQLGARTVPDLKRINAARRIHLEINRAVRRREHKEKPLTGRITENFEIIPD